jgi:hypothetical protein
VSFAFSAPKVSLSAEMGQCKPHRLYLDKLAEGVYYYLAWLGTNKGGEEREGVY